MPKCSLYRVFSARYMVSHVAVHGGAFIHKFKYDENTHGNNDQEQRCTVVVKPASDFVMLYQPDLNSQADLYHTTV